MSKSNTLWQAEARQLADWLAGVHGAHGLVLAPQCGADLSQLYARTGMMSMHYLHLVDEEDLSGAARFHLANWPLAEDSLDLLVLWHVVDRTGFWPMVLEEACRVLAPGGLMAVIYHGRSSPWRWRQPRHVSGWSPPGRVGLKRQLLALGLSPLDDRALSWQPPLGSGERWQRFNLDRWGPFWPWPAASRVAFSRLETPGMTPLFKRQARRAQPAVGSVGLAGRQSAARQRQELA